MKYASETEVSPEKTRMEIEVVLKRYGAKGFMYGWQESRAIIGFEMNGRAIKFMLPFPDPKEKQFTHFRHSSGSMLARTAAAAVKTHEQAVRQRWRALYLCIKAKLEAVEVGITTFEHEFLAQFVACDGLTIGDHIIPQLNDTTAPPTLRLMA